MFKNKVEYPIIFNIPRNFIYKNSSIHTYFMKIPIDLIFIDQNLKIYETVSLFPWKYFKPYKGGLYFIEFEYGYLNANNIKINDEIRFIN